MPRPSCSPRSRPSARRALTVGSHRSSRSARRAGSSASCCGWRRRRSGTSRSRRPSDVGFLLLVPPVVAAFVIAVDGRLPKAEEVAVYLDAARDLPRDHGRPAHVLRPWRSSQSPRVPVAAIAIVVPGRAPRDRRRRTRGAAARSGPRRAAAATSCSPGSRSSASPGSSGCARRSWPCRRRGRCRNYAFSVGILAVGVGAGLAHRRGDESPVPVGRARPSAPACRSSPSS